MAHKSLVWLDATCSSWWETGSVFSTHLAASYCLALIIVSSMVLLTRVFMSDVKALIAPVRVSPLLERNFWASAFKPNSTWQRQDKRKYWLTPADFTQGSWNAPIRNTDSNISVLSLIHHGCQISEAVHVPIYLNSRLMISHKKDWKRSCHILVPQLAKLSLASQKKIHKLAKRTCSDFLWEKNLWTQSWISKTTKKVQSKMYKLTKLQEVLIFQRKLALNLLLFCCNVTLVGCSAYIFLNIKFSLYFLVLEKLQPL